jgi:DNA polymerase III alpha subunit
MSIEKLIKEATSRGVTQMVLTDINNSTGIMEFMRACNKSGIKPIGGVEFRRNKQLLYIGVAKDKEGMKELNDFLTEHNLEQKELPDKVKPFKNAVVIYPYAGDNVTEPLGENEYKR